MKVHSNKTAKSGHFNGTDVVYRVYEEECASYAFTVIRNIIAGLAIKINTGRPVPGLQLR